MLNIGVQNAADYIHGVVMNAIATLQMALQCIKCKIIGVCAINVLIKNIKNGGKNMRIKVNDKIIDWTLRQWENDGWNCGCSDNFAEDIFSGVAPFTEYAHNNWGKSAWVLSPEDWKEFTEWLDEEIEEAKSHDTEWFNKGEYIFDWKEEKDRDDSVWGEAVRVI